jgi:acylphosphatase
MTVVRGIAVIHMKARAKVVFHGRVQGVWFRGNTQRFAIENGKVYGWVKNLPDRTVLAVFEGEKAEILKVISHCVHDQPYAKVTNHEVVWEDYKGEFRDFSIDYRR